MSSTHRRVITMKNLTANRKASSSVFAVTLLIIIAFAFGIAFVSFVRSEISFSWNTYASEMSLLVLKCFTVNATHIVANLQNMGKATVEITGAFVNGIVATVNSIVQIQPGLSNIIAVVGDFLKGSTYTVKLLNLFNTVLTFQINY